MYFDFTTSHLKDRRGATRRSIGGAPCSPSHPILWRKVPARRRPAEGEAWQVRARDPSDNAFPERNPSRGW